MFAQVKEAAGIHMATFKKTGDAPVDETATEDGAEDLSLSNWSPPPEVMAAFRKA